MLSGVFLSIFYAIACVSAESRSSKTSKYRPVDANCLNMSLSVWQKPRPSATLLDCFVSSRSSGLRSVGVVQRNKRDASCALFRFGQVCQLLSLINISSGSGQSQVEALCEIVVDSEYDAVAANEHFNAVWVADRGPEMENLVCGSEGQRNPMRSWNVSWTSEGAGMDGVSSRLWVDDPTGLDFMGSYTWVLHLKRTPRQQCFMELDVCASIGSGKEDLLWELSDVPRSVFLNPGHLNWFKSGSVLPSDPQQFSIVGASFNRTADRCRFFLGSAFLSEPEYITPWSTKFDKADVCIKIGWRSPTYGLLDGVIRAVAVANSVLSEDQIRQLFELL